MLVNAIVLFGVSSAAALHQAKLHRLPPTEQLYKDALDVQKYLRPALYSPGSQDQTVLDRTGHRVPIKNYQNALYYVEATIGESKRYNLSIDTGSGYVWVGSLDKGEAELASSSPFSKQTVRIDDIVLKNQDVLDLSVEYPDGPDMGSFGVFGLAYEAGHNTTPALQNMVKQRIIVDPPVFCLYLADSEHDSVITFGGIDHDHRFGYLVTLPVQRKGRWEVAIDGMEYGNDTISLHGMSAVLDSGTRYIATPTANRNLGAKDKDGLLVVDCEKRNQLPDLTFLFKDRDLSISAKDYIIKLDDICISVVTGWDQPEQDGPAVILGDPFLRNFLSVFDFGLGNVILLRSKPWD